MLTIIAAIGENGELGKNNNLIWKLPSDLLFFKQKTIGHKIIMGSKTYLSLPKILEDREHIVLTHNPDKYFNPEVTFCSNAKELIKQYKDTEEEVFIIGGSTIYKIFINYCYKMYLTQIKATYSKADTFFTFDKNQWDSKTLENKVENGISYDYVEYIKKLEYR